MINTLPDVKRFVPKHYLREYPEFVDFLQEYFNYLHRVRLLTPELEARLKEAFEDDRDINLLRGLKNEVDILRDQRNYTSAPEKEIVLQLADGRVLGTRDGRPVGFMPDNSVEIRAINADREFETEFDSIRGGIYGLNQTRFIRLFKDLKSIAGSQQIIKLFFSWLYDGEINVYYPKLDITKPDDNAVLDGRQKLRDDVFYSEFSYQVQAYGKQRVPVVEPFHDIYRRHFHPAGFSLFIENIKPNLARPFDFPLLVPSGKAGSYFSLQTPLVIKAGERLYFRTFQSLDISVSLDGPVFDDVVINEGKLRFAEADWEVTIDGLLVYDGVDVRLDASFHDYVFTRRAGASDYSVKDFLKGKTEDAASGLIPITNVKHVSAENEPLVEYRINNLSTTSIPAFGVENKKLPQLRGIYHLDETATQIVTEGLESSKDYMIYVNGADTVGGASFIAGGVPLGELDLTEEKSFYSFFKTGVITDDKLICTAVGGASKLQIVVYEIDPRVMTFVREDPDDFGQTGYWINSEGDSVDVIKRVVLVFKLTANDLDRFVRFTLPNKTSSGYNRLKFLVDKIGNQIENVAIDTETLGFVIDQELPSGQTNSHRRLQAVVQQTVDRIDVFRGDQDWFDFLLNEKLVYDLSKDEDAQTD